MNENSHAIRRRLAACAAAAVVLPGLAACGADLDPPAQDISREKVEKKTDTATEPKHDSGNRLDFGDEYGKRPAEDRKTDQPEERNLNRLDFRDNGL